MHAASQHWLVSPWLSQTELDDGAWAYNYAGHIPSGGSAVGLVGPRSPHCIAGAWTPALPAAVVALSRSLTKAASCFGSRTKVHTRKSMHHAG